MALNWKGPLVCGVGSVTPHPVKEETGHYKVVVQTVKGGDESTKLRYTVDGNGSPIADVALPSLVIKQGPTKRELLLREKSEIEASLLPGEIFSKLFPCFQAMLDKVDEVQHPEGAYVAYPN